MAASEVVVPTSAYSVNEYSEGFFRKKLADLRYIGSRVGNVLIKNLM